MDTRDTECIIQARILKRKRKHNSRCSRMKERHKTTISGLNDFSIDYIPRTSKKEGISSIHESVETRKERGSVVLQRTADREKEEG